MTARAAAVRQCGENKIQVDRIHFIGIGRTKNDALVLESKQLFLQKTFRDLVTSAYEAKRHMEKVGLFNEVDIEILTNENRNFEVQFSAREPTARAVANANVNNRGEAGIGIEGSLGTVFGRGELLSTEASIGHQHTSIFHLGFTKPLLKIRDASIGLHAFRSFADYPWTGICQLEHGVSAAWRWEITEKFVHELKWTGGWRRTECLSRTTPMLIREHSGHSVKSSIINSLKYSTLDSSILPTRGLSLMVSQEVAGLGGDTRFFRQDVDFRASAKLPLGLILSLSTNAAYVAPRGGRTLNLLDRLYLGGPTNLRGFAHHSIGPASDGMFLGGVGSFCAGVHLYRPLIPKRIVFAHLFATSGNICPVGHHYQLADVARRLIDQPRCSLGAGLVFKFGEMARLELNYCWPFTNHISDRVQPGFQLGIGVSFL